MRGAPGLDSGGGGHVRPDDCDESVERKRKKTKSKVEAPPGTHVLSWDGDGAACSGTNVKCERCERTCAFGTAIVKCFGKFEEPNFAVHDEVPCLGHPESREHYKRCLFAHRGLPNAVAFFRLCTCGSSFCGPGGSLQSDRQS